MNKVGVAPGPSRVNTTILGDRTRWISLWRGQSGMMGTLSAAVAGQALLIISGIAVARLLGPESRGHLQLFVLAPALVAHVGTLGLPSAVTYYVARATDSSSAILALLTRPLVVLTTAMMLGMAIVMAVALSGVSNELRPAGFVVVAAVPGVVSQRIGLAVLQGQQRFLPFNILRNLQVAGWAFAALALLLVGTGDLLLVTAVWTASTLASGAITLLYAASTTRTSAPAGTDMGQMTRFGAKSLASAVSPLELLRLDQIALAIVGGPVALGIYVVGMAFSNLPRFIAQSMGMVAYPRISGARERPLRQALHYVLGVAAISGLIVIVLQITAPRLVPWLFGRDFLDAVAVTRIALVAAFLFSLRRILTDCARGLGLPGIGSIAEIVATAVSIALVLALGARWGAEGAAWGLTVGAGAGLLTLVILLSAAVKESRSAVVTASSRAGAASSELEMEG